MYIQIITTSSTLTEIKQAVAKPLDLSIELIMEEATLHGPEFKKSRSRFIQWKKGYKHSACVSLV